MVLTPPSFSRRSSNGKRPVEITSVSVSRTLQSWSSSLAKPTEARQRPIGTTARMTENRLRPVAASSPPPRTVTPSGAAVIPRVAFPNLTRSAGFRTDRLSPSSPTPTPPRDAARASTGGTG